MGTVLIAEHHKALYLKETPFLEKYLSQIVPTNRPELIRLYDQLRLKAYSQNTIRIYISEFVHLLGLLKDYPVADLNIKRLKDYFLYCVNEDRMGERKINAIKFYYEKVLHRPQMFFDIPRPKKPATLPKMLSKKEVVRLFAQVNNFKHLIALELCYGMGSGSRKWFPLSLDI